MHPRDRLPPMSGAELGERRRSDPGPPSPNKKQNSFQKFQSMFSRIDWESTASSSKFAHSDSNISEAPELAPEQQRSSRPEAPEEEEESENDDSSAHTASRARQSFCRKLLVVALAVGIILGSSVGIGLLVTGGDLRAHRSAALDLQEAQDRQEAQRLLELAESIVVACSDPTNDECPALCDANMCCINHGDPCGDGIKRECAAYAGCRALLDGRRE